jgi:hypothetical protein
MFPNQNYHQTVIGAGDGQLDSLKTQFSRYFFINPRAIVPNGFHWTINPSAASDRQLQNQTEVEESLSKNEDIEELKKRENKDKLEIRSTPEYSHLNYLNVPPESSLEPYKLFPNFNFAVPSTPKNVFEFPKYDENFSYEKMRKDFEANGRDASVQKKSNFELHQSNFPTLQSIANVKQEKKWKMSLECEDFPMLPTNQIAERSKLEDLSKKLQKILIEVSSKKSMK